MFIPVAHAFNFVNLGTDFASNTLNVAGSIFSDFGTMVQLIIGVVLAIAILGFLLNAFRHH